MYFNFPNHIHTLQSSSSLTALTKVAETFASYCVMLDTLTNLEHSLLSMLLVSRSMDSWNTCISSLCSIHKLLFQSSASSFSSQYLLLFLKSSRNCVLLPPTPFTSVICPSMPSWWRQFLLRIWPIQLAFLRRILFTSVLFSPIRSRTCSLVTFSNHFISLFLLHYHFSKFPKYFCSNFPSVQVFFGCGEGTTKTSRRTWAGRCDWDWKKSHSTDNCRYS